MIDANCPLCTGVGWVCEDHPDQHMDHLLPDGTECGGAGDKCFCNPLAELGGEIYATNDARDMIGIARKWTYG
jgi:hypothetical protein